MRRPPRTTAHRRARHAAAACALATVLLALPASCALSPQPFAQVSGLLLDERLVEVSGLAASRHLEGVLWTLNDGGGGPHLHAIGTRGQYRGTLDLDGVANTDWEDLAGFGLDGRRYLLVADTGDNGGLRHTLQLHAVEEPARLHPRMRARVAWTVVFRWPDGPRDCEAIAVDAAAGRVLLVSKRRHPAELFSVPLRPANDAVQVAERIGTLAGVPRATEAERADDPERARLRGQVTAADIAPDGGTLAVMTYDDVLLYGRAGDGWGAAVDRPPRRYPLTLLPQAEAIAWSATGHALYATGEFRPAPLLVLRPD